jgi:hypothetical protein
MISLLRFALPIYFMTIPITSISKEVHLICEGSRWWNGQNEGSDKFSLTVDTSDGSMYGMPSYKVPGCVEINEKKPNPKYKITENNVSLECENDIASTTWNLNRYTLLLRYSNYLRKDRNIDLGEYKCKKIDKQF